jgi:hypothetical protein
MPTAGYAYAFTISEFAFAILAMPAAGYANAFAISAIAPSTL